MGTSLILTTKKNTQIIDPTIIHRQDAITIDPRTNGGHQTVTNTTNQAVTLATSFDQAVTFNLSFEDLSADLDRVDQ